MTKEYKPNKMEKQILDDVNSMATSLKEISQAVNVLANAKLVHLNSDYVVRGPCSDTGAFFFVPEYNSKVVTSLFQGTKF